MEYHGNKARVPHGDGTWSKFLPIPEAQRYAHTLSTQRFLNLLRAGKTIIGLHSDAAAISAARRLYTQEREAGTSSLPSHSEAAQ